MPDSTILSKVELDEYRQSIRDGSYDFSDFGDIAALVGHIDQLEQIIRDFQSYLGSAYSGLVFGNLVSDGHKERAELLKEILHG